MLLQLHSLVTVMAYSPKPSQSTPPILFKLHWPPVSSLIYYKALLVIFKSLNDLASWVSELLQLFPWCPLDSDFPPWVAKHAVPWHLNSWTHSQVAFATLKTQLKAFSHSITFHIRLIVFYNLYLSVCSYNFTNVTDRVMIFFAFPCLKIWITIKRCS